MRLYYCATAVDNLVISQNHAVTFTNETLDYIPGSVVLGAIAAECYRSGEYTDAQLFDLFQNSSANAFSNAYPLNDDLEPVFPSPLCIHYEKEKKPERQNLVNKCVPDNDSGVQYKQLRSGFFSADLKSFSIKRGTMTRTSVDFESQTAEDGNLFNQKYIHKGFRFAGYIEFEPQYEKLIRNFLNHKQIRIGKSRCSEFGRVELQIIDSMDFGNPPATKNQCLYLWCLSDCQFINLENGQPSLVPQGSNLWSVAESNPDLDIKYDAERSFVRTCSKRYFNRKRGGFDGDRLLVSKGSIICFTLNRDLDGKVLDDLQKQGIGLDRQLGFGQVLVNPAWIDTRDLSSVKLFKSSPVKLESCASGKCKINNPYLIACLKKMDANSKNNELYVAGISKFIRNIADIYNNARRYSIIEPSEDFGPTATQWNEIFTRIKNCKSESYISDIEKIVMQNIGRDLYNNSENTKKETTEFEKTSWAARLYNVETGTVTYFAEELLRYLNNSGFDRDQMLYNLEVLVKNDFSRYDVLLAKQREYAAGEKQ